ncbi:putative nicotinamide n-methyltransferase protein [Teratosphaeria destructans]|uniref:Nicotinamide n-methyltransferase protein n=1 Tax=Teratosphaeria destructans TaxID=418781 RepID=A0A9W7SVR3_9PEZI|nr:putative nicotinamide n-methyltransferase protein [Teratosphaeria destructans]
MDPQLLLFRRQYLQLLEPNFLAWPPKQLLKDPDVQSWLYKRLFDSETNDRAPPARYQLRVLKALLTKIEQSVEDPEEDSISDGLMSHLSTLMASQLPSELIAAQHKTYVTFSCLPPSTSTNNLDADEPEPTVTLLERRNLISGSQTTGFRTWEAALHLGSFLLCLPSQHPHAIKGKSVLELGAGTGFLSILCAKHLHATHVTTTDGDEGVVEALKENLFLNDLDEEGHGRGKVVTSVLRWGHGLKGTWVEEDCEAFPYDVVIGADITYDKIAISSLVATLRLLFDLRPKLQVIISGAVRNIETFETFRQACYVVRSKFAFEEIDFQPTSMREQTALFYATAVPLKILSIGAGSSI